MSRVLWVVVVGVVVSCAQVGASRRAEGGSEEQARAGWVPEAGAGEALERVWAAAPFTASPRDLALASGGTVARMFSSEILGFESHVEVDVQGRARATERSLWRVLTDSPDQTLTVRWAPWRQGRPTVRARVISPTGVEQWLDAASVVEAQGTAEGVQLTDSRVLQVPLPGVKRGSVVEYETVISDTRPTIEGLGVGDRWTLWTPQPVRHQRFVVEVPEGSPLTVHAVGVPVPPVKSAGGTKRVELEVGALEFTPFTLSRAEREARRPAFGWTTVPAWSDVATKYAPLLSEGLADSVELGQLEAQAKAATTVEAKTQLALRWLSDRARYTAVHLGEGAFMPTKPSTVLARGYGDCKDLSLLLVSTLRRLGVQADVALVSSGGQVPLDTLPTLEAFNHAIVAVKVPGRSEVLWVDPTTPEYPVGTVAESVRDQRALLAKSGGGLVSTPRRADTVSRVVETVWYDLAAFGRGSGRIRSEFFGDAEGIMRRQTKACDAAAAHELGKNSMSHVFGDDATFTATLSRCKPGEGPVLIEATAPKVRTLDTGDAEAQAPLPATIIGMLLDHDLIGESPDSDERTPEEKEEQRRQQLEQYGMTEETFGRSAETLDSTLSVSRTYRLKLPARFVPAHLPPARTLAMGPGRWSETFSQPRPDEVEVTFLFEVSKVDWTPDDVDAFRAAYWKRFSEPMATLAMTFAPVKLLQEEKAAEAMALARTWLQASPNDAVTRARFARMLLTMGLGELADVEAERAVRDAPNEPLVVIIRGDTARSSDYGLLYDDSFDRAQALASFRLAHRLLPEHGWVTTALVRTLRVTAEGELEPRWTPEIQEAAKLLEQRVEEQRATEDDYALLSEMYMRGRQVGALKRLFEKNKDLRESNEPMVQVLRDAVCSTPEQVLARLNRIADPKDRFGQFLFLVSTWSYFRNHQAALTVLAGFRPAPGQEQEFAALQQIFRPVLRPVPERNDVSTPEAGARTVMALMANAGSPADASKRLATLASKTGVSELDGSTKVFRFARMPSIEQSPFEYEWLFHGGECGTVTKGQVARVKCFVPANRKIGFSTYWTKGPAGWQLESLGKPGHLAELAWTGADRQPVEAAAWVDWALEEMLAREATKGNDGYDVTRGVLKKTWAGARREDLKAIRFAASMTFFFFNDTIREAPAEAVEVFRQGLSGLGGATRRDATQLLVRVLDVRGQQAQAAAVLRPLAETENEPVLWRWLADLEIRAGNDAAGRELVSRALAATPDDIGWREFEGFVLLQQGRWKEAHAALKRLRAEKGDAVDVQNNLMWSAVMAGPVDDETLREASALAASKDVSGNAMSTVAHVLMERGRLAEASKLLIRRHQRVGRMDGAQWLARGRMLQLLGYPQEAEQAFAKIAANERELVAAAKQYGAQAPRASR